LLEALQTVFPTKKWKSSNWSFNADVNASHCRRLTLALGSSQRKNGVLSIIKRWYNGTGVIHDGDNDPDSTVFIMPSYSTEYHWSAKMARAMVDFYIRNWQWVWGTVIGAVGLYLTALSLK
jgi:hypothetical protein